MYIGEGKILQEHQRGDPCIREQDSLTLHARVIKVRVTEDHAGRHSSMTGNVLPPPLDDFIFNEITPAGSGLCRPKRSGQ